MATNYSRGYAAENKCVNELKDKGYVAFRSAGSHSPADVVAVCEENICFIQVKTVMHEKDVAAARKAAIKEIQQLPTLRKDKTNYEWEQQMYREVWVKVHGKKGWATKEFV